MSGYGGTDDEALHALILAENGVASSQQLLKGTVLVYCLDCGDEINPARRKAALALNHKCERCISCQKIEEKKPKRRIRMLDHIL